tara:strand:- start:30 stop:737 length:708 start_codon:yes stop_codon:yes gene_type:complete
MNPTKYYDKNASFKKRNLSEGTLDERNAHNFIKTVVISEYVKKGSFVLDLGCGKGGDVIKFKFSKIKKYKGVDISKKSLEVCKQRLQNVDFEHELLNSDMWTEKGFGKDCYDIISSQFSLHYCFDSEEKADQTFKNIYESLKPGGYFIGTIPVSSSSYEKAEVVIPGCNDVFLEPTVSLPTFITKATQYNLNIVKIENFLEFYNIASKTNNDLLEKMKANLFPPKNNYFVFVLEK